MEIVPISTQKKSETGLDFIISRKAELKKEILNQKILISTKTQNLLSQTSFTNYLFRSFNKGLNVVDGIIMGYKMVKSIRAIFRKFK